MTKLASCGVSAHYYLSFAYCMTRRFPDAHRMLCTLLRTHTYETLCKLLRRTIGYETGGIRKRFGFSDQDDEKKNRSKDADAEQELSDKDIYHKTYLDVDAMLKRAWAMLAIAQTQSPSDLGDVLSEALEELYGDDIQEINDDSSRKDQRRERYEKLFQTAAPDFINTFDPFEFENLAKLSNQELCNKQFQAFMRLTKKRHDMLKIKNEIRLFRVIPLAKLAKAMDYEETEIGKLNRELIRLKWRMKQNKKVDSWGNTNDQFTFHIKDDCVYVTELQTSQLWKYSDYFIKNIQDVTDWIERSEDNQ